MQFPKRRPNSKLTNRVLLFRHLESMCSLDLHFTSILACLWNVNSPLNATFCSFADVTLYHISQSSYAGYIGDRFTQLHSVVFKAVITVQWVQCITCGDVFFLRIQEDKFQSIEYFKCLIFWSKCSSHIFLITLLHRLCFEYHLMIISSFCPPQIIKASTQVLPYQMVSVSLVYTSYVLLKCHKNRVSH